MRQQITYHIKGVEEPQHHTINHPQALSLNSAEEYLKSKSIPFSMVSGLELLDVESVIDNLFGETK